QGADAIFTTHPYDDQRGLMSDSGTPGDLLLPWRTTASLLGGAKFVGSIQLPHGSKNRLFQRPNAEMLMVVWSDHRTREIIYLGDKVSIVDVWGRTRIPRRSGSRQMVDVDRLPVFVRGLNPHVARLRMSVKFDELHIPSVFGKPHSNQIQFHNEFPQGVGGTLSIKAPDGWQISPDRIDLKMAADDHIRKQFEVSLPFDANSGLVPIRIDFDVVADKSYKFSVYRELDVGDGQLEIDIHTRLEKDGDLIVEQRMTNRSDRLVDFKCLLYALGSPATSESPGVPQRRRQRTQVFRLGNTPDVKSYRYPNGAELLGTQMWLRAEEIDGSRVLNYRFDVER
ncbi:MAG: hypothetical protein KDA61_11950, partial [Planctomycetales bacterium]|nr:hypothetical protein [Planctomycetales bacterium]